MKKKIISIIVIILSTCYFSLTNIKLNLQNNNNSDKIITLNVEALASNEDFSGWNQCVVGNQCYVLASASRWCGTCQFDYIYVTGDGLCSLW